MYAEDDSLESDPRQPEYARALALPQALSLDLSPVVLTSILGMDPLIPHTFGGGEDSVRRLTPVVTQRLLLDLCRIRVVLALPVQCAHSTKGVAVASQSWLEWCTTQGMDIGQVSGGPDFPWHMLYWNWLSSLLSVWRQLTRTGSGFSWKG